MAGNKFILKDNEPMTVRVTDGTTIQDIEKIIPADNLKYFKGMELRERAAVLSGDKDFGHEFTASLRDEIDSFLRSAADQGWAVRTEVKTDPNGNTSIILHTIGQPIYNKDPNSILGENALHITIDMADNAGFVNKGNTSSISPLF